MASILITSICKKELKMKLNESQLYAYLILFVFDVDIDITDISNERPKQALGPSLTCLQ